MQKIERRRCQQRFSVLPECGYDPVTDGELIRFPQTVMDTVFILPAASFSKLALKFGDRLAAAVQRLGVDSLIFLGDNELPWRKREVSYPPAARGLRYLESLGIGKQFNGGLQFKRDMLPVAMRHMLWLIRTNAVLSDVWFTDPDQRFTASPCKYGGLHLGILADQHIESVLSQFSGSGFVQIESAACLERFTDGGIPGRTTPI